MLNEIGRGRYGEDESKPDEFMTCVHQFAQSFKEAHNENVRKREEEERIKKRREEFLRQMQEKERLAEARKQQRQAGAGGGGGGSAAGGGTAPSPASSSVALDQKRQPSVQGQKVSLALSWRSSYDVYCC